MLDYLDSFWKSMVHENGYIDIESTLYELDLQLQIDDLKKTSQKTSMIRLTDFKNIYLYNIKPLNCLITYKENENRTLNFSIVRPALPELTGKLYGICVEIEQFTFSVRIFGLIDPDSLKNYRNQLPLKNLYNDIKIRYGLDEEEVKPYVESISYRDLLINDIRHLTNRVKHFYDKLDFYKNSEFTLILGEYDFLTESMKVDFITYLINMDLIDLANFLYKKNHFL